MGTNYIAPIWRMPRNANKDKLSNYNMDFQSGGAAGRHIGCGTDLFTSSTISSISISCWIKTTVGNANAIVSKDLATNGNRNFLFQIASGNVYWQHSSNGNSLLALQVLQSEYNVLDGNWHNIIVTLKAGATSGTAEKKIYIDGQLRATDPAATIPEIYNTTSVPIEIGRRGDSTRYYTQSMSQVCIFDYCLSSSQVSYLYNLNNPMAITGGEPVAYWPLGDNSNPNSPGSFPNISVGADSVFQFDVGGDRIDLGPESNLEIGGASKYSTSIWFKKADNGSRCIWGYNYGDANGSGFYFWFNSGALRIAVGNNSLSSDFAFYQIEAVNLPIDEWQHALVVFDGTRTGSARIKVYHNGAAAVGAHTRSENLPSTLPDNNGNNNRNVYLGQLQLGNGNFSYNYNGQLANVQQWTTALSLSNAETLYNNGQPLMTGAQPQEANLKAWYKLNQHDSYWDLGGNGVWTFNNAALN